jgi:hypothetical protein
MLVSALFPSNPPRNLSKTSCLQETSRKEHASFIDLLTVQTKEYKAGSIMLLVDPDKQDDEQIAHMKAAKARVDAALAPLTHEEANLLHKHYATIANFTSYADTGIGLAADPVGKYESIEKILKEIQETYKNTYLTSGALIGEQFYVRRTSCLKSLNPYSKSTS